MFSHRDQPSWQLRPLHLLQFPNNSHGNETSLQKPSSLCRKTRPKSFARMVNLPACLKHKPCFSSSFLLCLFPLDTGCSKDAHTGIKSPHNHLSEELNSTNSLLPPPHQTFSPVHPSLEEQHKRIYPIFPFQREMLNKLVLFSSPAQNCSHRCFRVCREGIFIV